MDFEIKEKIKELKNKKGDGFIDVQLELVKITGDEVGDYFAYIESNKDLGANTPINFDKDFKAYDETKDVSLYNDIKIVIRKKDKYFFVEWFYNQKNSIESKSNDTAGLKLVHDFKLEKIIENGNAEEIKQQLTKAQEDLARANKAFQAEKEKLAEELQKHQDKNEAMIKELREKENIANDKVDIFRRAIDDEILQKELVVRSANENAEKTERYWEALTKLNDEYDELLGRATRLVKEADHGEINKQYIEMLQGESTALKNNFQKLKKIMSNINNGGDLENALANLKKELEADILLEKATRCLESDNEEQFSHDESDTKAFEKSFMDKLEKLKECNKALSGVISEYEKNNDSLDELLKEKERLNEELKNKNKESEIKNRALQLQIEKLTKKKVAGEQEQEEDYESEWEDEYTSGLKTAQKEQAEAQEKKRALAAAGENLAVNDAFINIKKITATFLSSVITILMEKLTKKEINDCKIENASGLFVDSAAIHANIKAETVPQEGYDKEKEFEDARIKFIPLINKMLTIPILLKINSLKPESFKKIISPPNVDIELGGTITTINKNTILIPLMEDVFFVDLKEILNHPYIINIIPKEKIDTTNSERTNYKTIEDILKEDIGAGGVGTVKQYTHIKTFCDILQQIDYRILFREHQTDAQNLINVIYSIITRTVVAINHLFPYICVLNASTGFTREIDAIISKANSGTIYTFLKITNFEEAKKKYNQRFRIWFNGSMPRNMMILDYNVDNFPYYEKNGDASPILSKNWETWGKVSTLINDDMNEKNQRFTFQASTGDKVLQSVNSYDYTYLFGKFNEIFTPNLSNKDIAERQTMQNIIESVKNGSPVFMMGYGASGSGKTSSLIYFKGGKEKGILIELCDVLSKLGYDTLTVRTKEYFIGNKEIIENDENYKSNSVVDPIHIREPSGNAPGKLNGDTDKLDPANSLYPTSPMYFERGPYFFKKNAEEFELEPPMDNGDENQNDDINKFFHTYRKDSIRSDINEGLENSDKQKIVEPMKLGDALVQLIDVDRFVKATTNNPNSSRSHTVVYITLNGENKKPANIFVGDFAGVENAFKCESTINIENFLNIKRVNSDHTYDGNPYYSGEAKIYANPKNPDDFGKYTNFNPLSYDPMFGGAKTDLQIALEAATTALKESNDSLVKGTEKILKLKASVKILNSKYDAANINFDTAKGNLENKLSELKAKRATVEIAERSVTSAKGADAKQKASNALEAAKKELGEAQKNYKSAEALASRTVKARDTAKNNLDLNTTALQKANEQIPILQEAVRVATETLDAAKTAREEEKKREKLQKQENDEREIKAKALAEEKAKQEEEELAQKKASDDAEAAETARIQGLIDENKTRLAAIQKTDDLFNFENFNTDKSFIDKFKSNNIFGAYDDDLKKYILKTIFDKIGTHLNATKNEKIYESIQGISNINEVIEKLQKAVNDINTLSKISEKVSNDGLINDIITEYIKTNIFERTPNNDLTKVNIKFTQLIEGAESIGNRDITSSGSYILYDDYIGTNYKRNDNDELSKLKNFEVNREDKKNHDVKKVLAMPRQASFIFSDFYEYGNLKQIKEKYFDNYLNDLYFTNKLKLISDNYKKYLANDAALLEALRVYDQDKQKYAELNSKGNLTPKQKSAKVYLYQKINKYQNANNIYIFVSEFKNKSNDVYSLPIMKVKTLDEQFYEDLKKNLNVKSMIDPLILVFADIGIVNDINEQKFFEISNDSLKMKKINSVIPVTIEFYEFIKEKILETYYRLQYGVNICKDRNIEGLFINDSLVKIRETIREILLTKMEGVIYPSPDFIDICLDTYCPAHKECFQLPKQNKAAGATTNEKIPSIIFEHIKDYLANQSSQGAEGGDEDVVKSYKSKKDFYKNIIVAVFCVFNISRIANNPPPVPYIDINNLKHLFYYGKDLDDIREQITKEFIKTVKIISHYSKTFIDGPSMNELDGVIKPVFEKIDNEYIKIVGDGAVIQPRFMTFDEYKDIVYDTNKQKFSFDKDSRELESFINAVDKNNAASAVGTLEFLDQIAKFNTTKTICFGKKTFPYLSIDKIEEYKKNSIELYKNTSLVNRAAAGGSL